MFSSKLDTEQYNSSFNIIYLPGTKIDYWLCKMTWSTEYTVADINKWLHKHKFRYNKLKGLPYKADLEEQAKFITSYHDLKNKLAADETIQFMDTVHPKNC